MAFLQVNGATSVGRGGTPYFLIGFIKISQVNLAVAGGPDPGFIWPATP